MTLYEIISAIVAILTFLFLISDFFLNRFNPLNLKKRFGFSKKTNKEDNDKVVSTKRRTNGNQSEPAGVLEGLVGSSKYLAAVYEGKKFRKQIVPDKKDSGPTAWLELAKFDTWYAHALMYIGEIHYALDLLTSNLLVIEKINSEQLHSDEYDLYQWIAGTTHNHIGYILWMYRGEYQRAINEFLNSLSYFSNGGQLLNKQQATAFDNLGRVFSKLGYYKFANLLVTFGISLREDQNDEYRQGLSLNSYAILKINEGKFQDAKSLNERAIQKFDNTKEEKGMRGLGLAYLIQGYIYRKIALKIEDKSKSFQDLNKAKEYLELANNIFNDIRESIRIIQIENELGCVYREISKISSLSETIINRQLAKDQFKLGMKQLESFPDLDEQPIHYVDLCEDAAEIYSNKGNKKSRNEAVEFIEKAEKKILRWLEGNNPIYCDELYLRRGKLFALKAKIMAVSYPDEKVIHEESGEYLENLLLALGFLGKYYTPSGKQNHPFYPKSQPIPYLAFDQIDTLFFFLSTQETDKIMSIKKDLFPSLLDKYGLSNNIIESFVNEIVDFAVLAQSTNL